MMLLNVSDIGKIYNGNTLFQGASFTVEKGDKIGLVGVNGAGKTTLFKILMGEILPDMGEMYTSKECKVAYMEQHACNNSERTVYEEVLEVFSDVIAMEQELHNIQSQIDKNQGDLDALVRRQFQLNEAYEANRGFVYKSLIRSCLMGLGFSEAELGQQVSHLSGGQKTRVLLAKILLSGSNLLLLDEPTNHLDIPSVMWLEDFLRSYEGAVLVISHDRYFLDRVTTQTYEMECGRLTVYPGNYSKYLVLKEESMKTRMRAYENTMAEINRLEESARLLHSFNREKSVKRAENKEKQIERLSATLEKVETVDNDLHFSFAPEVTGGNEVLKMKGLAKSFGEKKLFSHADMLLMRGDRAFILGPNGCGKTTLLKIVLDQLPPDEGTVVLGSNIFPAYYEQTGASLLNGKSVINEVWDEYPNMTQTEIRSALAAFLFRGEDVFKEVEMLSGGERARVAILKILMKRANLLILDEPTNHLDITSREALERALADYTGTILCVSHDRYFINKLATSVYRMTTDGLTQYQGNYDDYVQRTGEEAQVQASQEKRPTEAKLDFKAQKELESRRRKAATAVRKAEEEVARLEAAIEQVNEELCSPEVSGDFEKAMEVNAKLQKLEAELEQAMEHWEVASAAQEELEG